jgi:hypothetical protein
MTCGLILSDQTSTDLKKFDKMTSLARKEEWWDDNHLKMVGFASEPGRIKA